MSAENEKGKERVYEIIICIYIKLWCNNHGWLLSFIYFILYVLLLCLYFYMNIWNPSPAGLGDVYVNES